MLSNRRRQQMKNNIKKLLASKISNYRISLDTGISQPLLAKYSNRKSEIGNMTLDKAIILNEYYIKIKEAIEMKVLVTEIRENYKTEDENERHLKVYESADEIRIATDEEMFEKEFTHNYVQKPDSIDELKYPIITFSYAGASDGKLFEVTDKDNLMYEANEYFDKKN